MSIEKMIPLMIGGVKDTLYMTLVSTAFAYLLGFPLAILLVLTSPKGLKPMPLLYRILDAVVNIFRSIPFLILLIMVIPLTRLIAGKAYGSTATIVPLVIAAAPYVARMIESSLLEVDPGVVEMAQSAGAGTLRSILISQPSGSAFSMPTLNVSFPDPSSSCIPFDTNS